ncbi:MAG: hypothetical protein P4K83_00265 [Terracidiphilus sp.]|nr:hypothetical protein [Terracidiphilus sp.]
MNNVSCMVQGKEQRGRQKIHRRNQGQEGLPRAIEPERMKVEESSASQEEAVKPAAICEEKALKAARRGTDIEPRRAETSVIDRLGPGSARAKFDQNNESRRGRYWNSGLQRQTKGTMVLIGVREVNVGHLDGGEQN